MAHFKTVTAVKQADEEVLAAAKGVNRAAAKAVYAYFHGEEENAAESVFAEDPAAVWTEEQK